MSVSKLSVVVVAALIAWIGSPVSAAPGHQGNERAGSATRRAGSPSGVPRSEGTIKELDRAAGKVTIAHGPLTNLDMPRMTMVFRVRDSAMLERIKPGDRIRFTADRTDGAFTVTQIEAAN